MVETDEKKRIWLKQIKRREYGRNILKEKNMAEAY